MMGNGYGMGMWGFGLLLVVGVGLLIALAVRALGGGVDRDTREPSEAARIAAPTEPPQDAAASGRSQAWQVLDERYARGELSTQEYRERLETLGDDT